MAADSLVEPRAWMRSQVDGICWNDAIKIGEDVLIVWNYVNYSINIYIYIYIYIYISSYISIYILFSGKYDGFNIL